MVNIDPTFMKDKMDGVIADIGESATLTKRVFNLDASEEYIDGDPTDEDSTITLVVYPTAEQVFTYNNQGVRITGDARAAIQSGTTIDLSGKHIYIITRADGTKWEIVAVEDDLDIETIKTGTDVVLRRREETV